MANVALNSLRNFQAPFPETIQSSAISGILNVEQGGTGSGTPEAARTALDAAAAVHSHDIANVTNLPQELSYRIEDKFKRQGTIPTEADLNEYRETGFYLQASSTSAAAGLNYPTPYAGSLFVFTAGAITHQTYRHYSQTATWVRSYYNSNWSAWARVLESNLLPYEEVVRTVSNQDISGTKTFGNIITVKNGTPGIAFQNTEGVSVGRLQHNGTNVYLSSDVGDLILRPSGYSSAAGQVRISTEGFFHNSNEIFHQGNFNPATKLDTSTRGAANGVAPLGADSLIPSQYLPSYVDDVLEYASLSAFPATGEAGKIYVDRTTNAVYRWTGSAYLRINDSVSTADKANTLATARTFSLTGVITAAGTTFNGSGNVTLNTAIADGALSIAKVDGLAAALAAASAASGIAAGSAFNDAFGSAAEYHNADAGFDVNTLTRGRKALVNVTGNTNLPSHSGITNWYIESVTNYGANDTRLMQTAHSYNGAFVTYRRRLFSDAWTPWIRVLDGNVTVNDMSGTLAVANGGTGATAAAAACDNLGAAKVAEAWTRGATGPLLSNYNGDMNDCAGFHAVYASTNATNRPPSNAAVIGFGTTNYTQQIALRNGIFNFRSQENGTWGNWDRVVSESGNHTFTGTNNYGLVRAFTGTAGTQVFTGVRGWSNGVTRWADVLEANGSYSLFSYSSTGGSGVGLVNFATTNGGGSNKMTVSGFLETGNITVGNTADCSIACVPTSGRAARFAATSSGNTGIYDQSNSRWLLQFNSADLATFRLGASFGGDLSTSTDLSARYMTSTGGRIFGSSSELNLLGGGTSAIVRIRPQGWTTSGQTVFNANGTVTFSGAATAPNFSLSSDERLKSEVTSLEIAGRIEPYEYTRNSTGERELGVMAGAVSKLYPTAVGKDDKGFMTVHYMRLIPVAFAHINKLEDEQVELKAQVQSLTEKNTQLEERLARLEKLLLK